MKVATKNLIMHAAVLAIMAGHPSAAEQPKTLPDLTQGTNVDRDLTYNLGSTGMRGWIYTKPPSYLDSLQGRTTMVSRQILVTHVGAKSPADGVMKVDDVILGTGGKMFNDDARKSIARAIQEAEKEENKGLLKLTIWRAGKQEEVALKLRIMGTYSDTAPYKCPKSKLIFEEACKALEEEKLSDSWHGAINGLALLSTGEKKHLEMAKDLARKMAPASLDLRKEFEGSAWDLGYKTTFLCEYYLLSKDRDVLHGIDEYVSLLARGQGMYGTFGHGFAALTPDGKFHGSVPPYGPVNMAGLPANLAVVLGKKCGVKDSEVDPAIARAAGFFGYFVDKGAIPYGEHEPWPFHENNGKNSVTALLFALQANKIPEAQFFAKMATAGYCSRECGHTGQGFSYLWSALGANVGGPAAAAAFFKEASWHFDLVRRSDGSFTYDGGEQYGPGKTDDNTYFGNSSYSGLSPNATYVLTYSMPLKKLYITGKDANPALALSKAQVANAIASGRFDLDRKKLDAKDLIAAFGDWSPIVRGWAAEELASRPEGKSMTKELISLAGGKDPHMIQGACQTLGLLNSPEALPVLVKQLSHENRWVRYKAAEAIKKMGGNAKPEVEGILKAVIDTAEPLYPVNWADPIQIAHGQLAHALFAGPLSDALKDVSPKLVYPAVRIVSVNADGMARATLKGFFDNKLSLEDVTALAPDLLAAVKTASPADTMFSNEIRMGAFKALTKNHFKEGIQAGVDFCKTQGGHGSEGRTGEIMKEIASYGKAAQGVIPELKKLVISLNDEVKNGRFPGGELNQRRTSAVENAIKEIEAATTQPEVRSLGSGKSR